MLGVALGVSGCGFTPQTEATQRPITLTFWTLQLRDYAPFIQTSITEFERLHPDTHVDWVDVPFAEGEKRALTAMLGAKVPDVINLNPSFAARLAQKGTLLPLQPYLSPQLKQAYVAVAWQAASLPTPQGGDPVGVPWYLTSKVVFAHAPTLKAMGLQQPPTSFTQLGQGLATLQADTTPATQGEHYGWYPPLADDGYWLKELHAMGLFNLAKGCPYGLAQQPALMAQVQRYADWYKAGLIPTDTLTAGHRDAIQWYLSGRLALLVAGTSLVGALQPQAPTVASNTLVSPQWPAQTAYADTALMVLSVPKRTAHPQQAVALALFMADATRQEGLSVVAPVLPSHKAALAKRLRHWQQQAGLIAGQPPNPQAEPPLVAKALVVSAQQVLAAKHTLPLLPQQADVFALANLIIQRILLGKTSVVQGLTEFDDQCTLLTQQPKS
jgi:putative chitobiose transport system substrate-binding protein